MLVWDERLGWRVAVETTPGEAPLVVGHHDGDTVPTPADVAVFGTNLVISIRLAAWGCCRGWDSAGGELEILDRDRLEDTACECYRIIKDEFDRLVG